MPEQMVKKPTSSQGAFRIVVYYALFGACWIFFSDALLGYLLEDKQLITRISMYKGWLFIAVTSVLLALLIRNKLRIIESSYRQVQEVSERYQAIIESLPEILFRTSREGVFIAVHAAHSSDLFMPADEFIGRHFTEVLPPELANLFAEKLEITIGNGVPVDFEYSLPINGERYFEARTVLCGTDEVLTSVRDVTARKKMEQALFESEERFRTLFESVPNIPVQGYDRSRRVIFWNTASEAYYGYSKHEALGRQLEELIIPPEMRQVVVAAVTDWLEQGIPVPAGELQRQKKDGSPAQVYSSHVLLVNTLGEPEMYCIDVDLTAQKKNEEEIRQLNESLEKQVSARTEELQTALRQMESFSYSISHDLRAPLRAIDGFVQILQDECADSLPPQAQGHLARIIRNARHMGTLIDDLLLFSRLGMQTINRQTLDPAKLVNAVLEDFAADIADRGIEVHVAPLPKCEADANLMRQVFANLIGNAVKFTAKAAAPRIDIGAKVDNSTPVYFVRDNGAGFDMAYGDKLFGVFQRLHSNDEFEGTGVGLAIVKNIIQRHSGTIWAEGVPGEGATFFFTL